MPLIALKPFLDGKGRMIEVGDALPADYDQPTLDHYARLGLAAEGKAQRAPRKPAGPDETKGRGATKPAEDAGDAKTDACDTETGAGDTDAGSGDTGASTAANPAAE